MKSKDGEDDWYQIHEVYYDEDNNVTRTIYGWIKNGATVSGNTIDEVRSSLKLMLASLNKEALNQNKEDE